MSKGNSIPVEPNPPTPKQNLNRRYIIMSLLQPDQNTLQKPRSAVTAVSGLFPPFSPPVVYHDASFPLRCFRDVRQTQHLAKNISLPVNALKNQNPCPEERPVYRRSLDGNRGGKCRAMPFMFRNAAVTPSSRMIRVVPAF